MYEGQLNDGRTAAAHAVVVSLAREGLDIRTDDDRVVELWPYDDLRVIEDSPGKRLRLTRRSDDLPRLVVVDPAFRTYVFERAPKLSERPSVAPWRGLGMAAAGLTGAALFVAALWFGLPLLARPIAMTLPDAFEDRVGQQVVDAMVDRASACRQPAGRAALDRLAARLAAAAGRPNAFQVEIVNRPTVNAFAAPGGYIVIFAGLIDKAESADEVAGVLAHEMGHVVHRHGSQALVRHFALSTILTIVTGNDWGFGTIAAGAGQIFLHLAHSREAEAEADATALDILRAARLDGAGLARFFARLEKAGASSPGVARYFATHPPLDERRAVIERAGVAGAPALSAQEWAALRAICKT